MYICINDARGGRYVRKGQGNLTSWVPYQCPARESDSFARGNKVRRSAEGKKPFLGTYLRYTQRIKSRPERHCVPFLHQTWLA